MQPIATRIGIKPETNPTVPHLQLTQKSPREIYDDLNEWSFSTFSSVREEPTRISVPSSRALWLDESVTASQDSFMPPPGGREFAHTHLDGSLHLMLKPEDEKLVLDAGWGELHPYHSRGVKEILVYAPRDDEELKIVKNIVTASYEYAMRNSK